MSSGWKGCGRTDVCSGRKHSESPCGWWLPREIDKYDVCYSVQVICVSLLKIIEQSQGGRQEVTFCSPPAWMRRNGPREPKAAGRERTTQDPAASWQQKLGCSSSQEEQLGLSPFSKVAHPSPSLLVFQRGCYL